MSTQNCRKPMKVNYRGVFALCAGVLLMSGCVIPKERGVVNETPPLLVNRVTDQSPSSLYRLQIKDQIDVEFAFHPEMNRTVRVRPDGMISVPRKNDVKVAGLTADETRDMLKKVYAWATNI